MWAFAVNFELVLDLPVVDPGLADPPFEATIDLAPIALSDDT